MDERCFVCMNPLQSDICSHCGHDNATPFQGEGLLLHPGSIVGGRYYSGLPIEENGEGITYIAYDIQLQARVRLREFFPDALCQRKADGMTVTVISGKEIQFKALMTDFVELSKQLISLTSNTRLLQAKDILADNGTVYTVYEDLPGSSLTRFLEDAGGDISWEDAENMFLPMLYTVKLLNSKGIPHKGICPDNLFITENREVRLKGVCTAAVRAVNTEIRPELFSGYSAPEQYETRTSHGEWTDVYAVCAVLYKALTGVTPPRANLQSAEGLLRPPIEINPLVPQSISDAIMRGLRLNPTQRTRGIKELIGDLYATAPAKAMPAPRRILDEEDDDDMTPPRRTHTDADAVRSKNSQTPHPKKKKHHVPIWLIVVLVTLPLMLLIFFLTYYYVLGDGSTPSSDLSLPSSSQAVVSSQPVSSEAPVSSYEEPRLPQVLVDNFVGSDYADIEASTSYREIFSFVVVEVYDDFAPEGEVIEQDLEPGTTVDKGSVIKLTVSRGMQKVTVPPYTNNGAAIPLEDYVKYFTDNGISPTVEQVADNTAFPGDIIGTSPEPGEVIDREVSSSITIRVAS